MLQAYYVALHLDPVAVAANSTVLTGAGNNIFFQVSSLSYIEMSYIFRFRGRYIQWERQLQSRKCADRVCQQSDQVVTIGLPYCAFHLVQHYKIKVASSGIAGAGLGLWCSDGDNIIDLVQPLIRRGTLICPYGGEVVSEQTCLDRYGAHDDWPYVIHVGDGVYEDAALVRGVGSCVNHTITAHANAEFCIHQNRLWLRATRHIYDETEILANYTPLRYGPRYSFRSNLHETLGLS